MNWMKVRPPLTGMTWTGSRFLYLGGKKWSSIINPDCSVTARPRVMTSMNYWRPRSSETKIILSSRALVIQAIVGGFSTAWVHALRELGFSPTACQQLLGSSRGLASSLGTTRGCLEVRDRKPKGRESDDWVERSRVWILALAIFLAWNLSWRLLTHSSVLCRMFNVVAYQCFLSLFELSGRYNSCGD